VTRGRPNRDELTEAASVALQLTSTTSITETEFAVYAHGAEAWVCPHCLTVNDVSQRMPLAPMNCERCAAVLQP
jgi:hypothetical protein